MVIDRTHRRWAIGSAIAALVATAIYTFLRPATPAKLFGGTALGITFGSIGSGLMIFEGLLGARQKVPVWRLGRLQTWMRGHLWLGLLSGVFILLHGRFALGHGLTRVLMILFVLVTLSGIVGVALQHYLPRRLTQSIPMETTFEQIDRVCELLVKEAEELIAAAVKQAVPAQAQSAAAGAASVATVAVAEDPAPATLRKYCDEEVFPFLQPRGLVGARNSAERRAQAAITRLRTLLPPPFHDTLDALREICGERAQLDRQRRMHYWLHGWLFVHIPLSYAVLVLGAVHAISSLRY
jgi:hypothetical protein